MEEIQQLRERIKLMDDLIKMHESEFQNLMNDHEELVNKYFRLRLENAHFRQVIAEYDNQYDVQLF
jgi:regulator of replication initiation timing